MVPFTDRRPEGRLYKKYIEAAFRLPVRKKYIEAAFRLPVSLSFSPTDP
jgi:hypothetical protein